jgi:Carboxypeptidase regulatory-like domain/TonB dependent receptor
MKKLFGSSFLWMRRIENFHVMKTEEFATPATVSLVWRLSMALLLGTMLLGFSAPLMGQAVSATLLGTVTDSSGAAVSSAKVTITETNTSITHTSQTNDSGNYVFPDLPPGTYTVTAEQSGFKRESRAGIDVIVNTTERVDLVLQPGNVSETITVEAETAILQTDRADVGEKIELTQLEELPIGGPVRNFQSLIGLAPGTVRPHRDHSEFFNSQDSLSTEVNGQSREFNQLMIEGVSDDERTGLLQIYIPPAEAIQAADVSTSNYTAEFGRAAGAVTNVILKSGTNRFHGSAYEYNRVSALAARSFFNRAPNPVARTTYNYFGGSMGGPIIKNKTFFFADILHISDVRGQFNLVTVPTEAFRSGDLSAGGSPVYNPFTGNPDGTGRTQFQCDAAGNPIVPNAQGVQTAGTNCAKIPSQLFSPIALKILNLVPHAQSTALSNNLSLNTQLRKNPTSFDVKIDHNWTNNDRLDFRFSRSVQNVFQSPLYGSAFSNSGGPGPGGAFMGTGVQHVQSGAINETHTFSPAFITELRAGISHYRNIAHQTDYGTNAAAQLGIQGANLDNAFTSGIVSIDVQGGFGANGSSLMVGYSASQPWDRGETNINLVNIWTKIHNNNAFKWGADIRRLRDDLTQGQTFSPRGLFRFGSGTTSLSGAKTSIANNFAAFLIDTPTEVGRDIAPNSGSWRETELFFFGQDTWHATNKLTVDAGLRWEFYLPPTPSLAGGWSNYDPTNNTLVQAGISGNPLNLGRETYLHYFAPRFGLAYRLNEQTVLRSAFGISYAPFTNNQYAFNYPLRSNQDSSQANGNALPTLQGGPANMATGIPAAPSIAVLPGGLVTPRPGEAYTVVDKHFQQPYVESWNLAIQRALPKNFALEVAYVGNHGVKIPMAYNLNAALAPSLCTAQEIALNVKGFCTNSNGTPKNVGDIQGNNCVQGFSTRPLCNAFGAVISNGALVTSSARTGSAAFLFKPTTSNYHSLQVKLDRRFTGGLLLKTAYTYAKELAFRSDAGADDGAGDLNFLNFSRNYAVLSRNRKHTFVQSFVYELPFGQGKPWLRSGAGNWIFGNWGLSGIITRMSGTPLHFTASGTSLAASGTTQTPIQVAPFHVLGGIDNDFWFDTSAFCPVGAAVTTLANGVAVNCPASPNGVQGNMARYAFSGPGFFNFDAAAFRRFSIREGMGLEFRLEAFSVTNTPQFSNPNTDITNTSFGKIKGVDGGNRSIEMSARFYF